MPYLFFVFFSFSFFFCNFLSFFLPFFRIFFKLELDIPRVSFFEIVYKFNYCFIKLPLFFASFFIVFFFNNPFYPSIRSLIRVVHVSICKSLQRAKLNPLFVKFEHFLSWWVRPTKSRHFKVFSSVFFLLLFFSVERAKQSWVYFIKVIIFSWVKSWVNIFGEVLKQLLFSYVYSISFFSFFNIFASEYLIFMIVIPSTFMSIWQNLICFLYGLKLFCRVKSLVLIWMPFKSYFLVSSVYFILWYFRINF